MKENKNLNNDKCFVVYMHTSPNNKRYVGITRQNPPEKRWGHNGCGYNDNEHFRRAISKYSWDNFKHEILYVNLTEKEAKQKEIELIAFYDLTDPNKGFNITPGGDYNINVTPKPVKQYTANGTFIKEYECIKYAANETDIAKGSISLCCHNKAKFAGGYIWRFVDVELTKEHIVWCNSDKRSENCIAVHRYSMSGEFIQEYESLTIAGLATDTDPTSITLCCKGEYKSVADSIWRYAWEELTQEHIEWCNKPQGRGEKEVSQYLRDGTFVCKYESIGEAYLKTGVSRCNIGACCRGDAKTAGNYLWRFSDEEITQEYIEWCNRIEQCEESRKRAEVVQYTIDGLFVAIYKSLTEAEKITGVSRKSIVPVCKGNRTQAGGFIWRYASDITDPTTPLFPAVPTTSLTLSETA